MLVVQLRLESAPFYQVFKPTAGMFPLWLLIFNYMQQQHCEGNNLANGRQDYLSGRALRSLPIYHGLAAPIGVRRLPAHGGRRRRARDIAAGPPSASGGANAQK